MYKHTEERWRDDPAHQYLPTIHKRAGSYLQEEAAVDKQAMARKAKQRWAATEAGGRWIMRSSVLKYYFEQIYAPL